MQAQLIPLFLQVAETIKTRIFNHEYGPGDSIPSAKELENEFKVSNITIRRAMDLLAKGGYVVSKRGRRAQVAHRKDAIVEIEIAGDFRTWIDSAVGSKFGVIAQIIDRQIISCPQPIADILVLDPAAKVERIKRIRKLKGKPVSYVINYGPSRLFTKLPNREIEKLSFVDAFQKGSKIKLKSMTQRVQASSADMDLAGLLQVDFGFPLFYVRNVYYADEGRPMVITQMYYRSDYYVYTAKRVL